MPDLLIRLVWWLSRLIMPLTHRRSFRNCNPYPYWIPRWWAWPMWNFPWLWCSCGDSLETWQQVKRGKCWICQSLEEDVFRL